MLWGGAMNMNQRAQQVEKQIAKVKAELLKLSELRPGSLSQQYNVCGNPSCRCKASPPQRHGPYYQLNYTRKGKGGTRFVKQEEVKLVKRQIDSYARLRTLVDRWIDLGTELAELKLAAHRKSLEPDS